MPGYSYLWQRSIEKAMLWIMDFGEVAKIQGQKNVTNYPLQRRVIKKL